MIICLIKILLFTIIPLYSDNKKRGNIPYCSISEARPKAIKYKAKGMPT